MIVVCSTCGIQIPAERLEALPGTQHCVKCAPKHAPKRIHDPNVLCAKSAPSGQNGFSPKD